MPQTALTRLFFASFCLILLLSPIQATKYCVQNSGIQVCTSSRCAGAIDYVSWNGKQFISDYDHGRELQIAVTVDNTGECYNPTEAGSLGDGAGQSTSSR